MKQTPSSLDELDRQSFAAGPSPLEAMVLAAAVEPGEWPAVDGPAVLSLDGIWQLAEGGIWSNAVEAPVPGSVHTALLAAGKIPDPTIGKQDEIARRQSFKTWWMRTRFGRPAGGGHRLIFDGVANRCTVWLNGTRLGEHEGMFGGPEFDVAPVLRDDNELVVKIEPVPDDHEGFWQSNQQWRDTVTFNCCYGWHYVNLPALGIWRPVRVEAAPAVCIGPPLIATADPHQGVIDAVVDLSAQRGGWRGRLRGTISAANFDAPPCRFAAEVSSDEPARRLRLRLVIPHPRPWWPNGQGEANLYRLRLDFVPAAGQPDTRRTTFGLRTIEMRPLPGGPAPERYNWQFVINGRPMFVKGSGWCTMDALMDFRRERYERFLTLARQQNCQMLRAWGGGMPETDDFYDLCDRLGLMVMQEWPTAWNSHRQQPMDALEETVRRNTLRLRNHASLVMWGAGNESSEPFGPAIDMMGRLAIELDGTRPFHRGEAWGGSEHNYGCWWERKPLNHNLTMTAPFWGEFGIASLPAHSSVLRYLPEVERTLWPPPEDGSFAHHTPVFNRAQDMERLRQYAGYFTRGSTLRRFVEGSQLAQAVAVRHTLERARTRWPDCAGALMYKLNDIFPAASWSTVDWYGATKIAHWFVRAAFAPLHACVLFDTLDCHGRDVAWPVWLLDDAGMASGCSVRVRAFDQDLRLLAQQAFEGGPGSLGTFNLSADQTHSAPLFVVCDLLAGGQRVGGTWYWLNFEQSPDCLFERPRTTLTHKVIDGRVRIRNTGNLPALGVHVIPSDPTVFEVEDNYFWLDAGEARALCINSNELRVAAWNAGEWES